MTQNLKILHTFAQPVILLGGGEFDPAQLQSLLDLGYPLIAADGGANTLANSAIVPTAIIGDLDSLNDIAAWQAKTQVHHQPDQATTDFEKCLTAIKAPLFLCLGFWGDNLGHSLACLHLLTKYHRQKNIVILTKTEAMHATGKAQNLTLTPQQPLSIYPLEPIKFAHSAGLTYPLDGLAMAQGGTNSGAIGTSNSTNKSQVAITPAPANKAAYLTIIPIKFWRQFAPTAE